MAEAAGAQAGERVRAHADAVRGRDALGVVGMSLLITWSFLFWNGPLLDSTLQMGPGMDVLFLGQGVSCALAALAFVFASAAASRAPGWFVAFGYVAASASLACALDWVAVLLGSRGLALGAFCLSGVGSALFLCWQEYLSVRGVSAAAGRLVAAYALAGVEFLVVSAVPSMWVELVSIALPLASFGCAVTVRGCDVRSATGGPSARQGGPLALEAPGISAQAPVVVSRPLSAVPWRLPVIVAIAHFCYGVTRVGGIVVDSGAGFDAASVLGAAVPIACCLLGAALAYLAYRTNAIAGLYVAFPMLALGCLVDPGSIPWGGVATFAMVNVGSELIRFLTWFLMIDVIVKDGASALLCVALLRVAHWGGCTLGQSVSIAMGDGSMMASVAIVLLMVGLFAILGTNTLFARQSRDGKLDDGSVFGLRAADGGGAAEPCAADGDNGVTAFGDLAVHGKPGVEHGVTVREAAVASSAAHVPSSPVLPRSVAGEALQRRVERTAQECGLSPRETEVLAIWVTGRTASYIEKVLFISHSTVKTHLNHIYAKTCTSNREELIDLVNSRRAAG